MAKAFTDRRRGLNPEATPTQNTIKLACSDRLWEQWQENPSPVLRLTVRCQEDGTGKVTKIRAPRERGNENTQGKETNSSECKQQQKLISLSEG